MSKLKFDEIKNLDDKTINLKIDDLKKEYFSLKMQKSVASVDKPHRFKEIKKDVARLKTAKRMK